MMSETPGRLKSFELLHAILYVGTSMTDKTMYIPRKAFISGMVVGTHLGSGQDAIERGHAHKPYTCITKTKCPQELEGPRSTKFNNRQLSFQAT